uniref:Putative secreted protein n=1 Tax=Ixodes ricinus TaxID=34613 RepID=A0A6B0TUX7_IXORI
MRRAFPVFFFIIIFAFCRLCCVEVPARRGGVCSLHPLRPTVFSVSWMLYLVSSFLSRPSVLAELPGNFNSSLI